VNSSQAQTLRVAFLFTLVLGCIAVGVVGFSSTESLAAAQLAVRSSGVQEARVGFLHWGALGALVTVVSMRWVRSVSEDEANDSSAEPGSSFKE
jgi:hypothetical protein